MCSVPVFSVIIPVFNKWELTQKCLVSLKEHTVQYDYEVIVVDNASDDDTARELYALGTVLFGDRFKRIRFDRNMNFGPASNAGAAQASAPLLFFLNNDTIVTSGWSLPLLKALDDNPRLGAVGPLLLYDNNTVQHLGIAFSLNAVEHLYQGFPSSHRAVHSVRELQAITGAALLVPASIFAEHGGFHEGYRNGYEDLDLCLHMRRSGKTLQCIPQSVIYHLESQTPGRKLYEDHNRTLFMERCTGYFYPDLHNFVNQDGFYPFLDDNLDIAYRLQDIDDIALEKAATGKTIGFAFSLLASQPMAVRLRRRIAKLLEARGENEAALTLHFDVANILCTADAYKLLALAAARASNKEILEYGENVAAQLVHNLQDKESFHSLNKRITSLNDTVLASLFESKCGSLA